MNILSDFQIEKLEKFINENEELEDFPCIESTQMTLAEKFYNECKIDSSPFYYKFGSSGFYTYALYKAKDSNLYLIVTRFQELYEYKRIKG